MVRPRRPLLPPAWPRIAVQELLRPLTASPCMQCDGPEGDPLCATCLASLRPPRGGCPRCLGSLSRPGRCRLCSRGALPFEAAAALGTYAGGLQRAIKAMKYRGRVDIALRLGDALADRLGDLEGDWLVVPVPVHATRRLERGYNQVEPLAWQVARRRGWSYDDRAVRRLGCSDPFYRQGLQDRWSEAQRAFHAAPGALSGRSVLVVDDILTSGATLWSLAEAARAAGARRVRVAVLARAVQPVRPA